MGQTANNDFKINLKNWNLKLISGDHFFPTYLADPLGVRFEVSSQTMLYSDYDQQDQINEGGAYRGRLNGSPGVRLSLFKFSPNSNPKLGVEIDLGLNIPVQMRAGNNDLIGTDGIYFFAIAAKPTEWLSIRFSKHHICTHLGDEFPTATVISPTDFDPSLMQLPVRDDFILSAAVKPLYFLKNPRLNILQIYGDFGFFLPGADFLGTRQNKPHRNAILNLQGGAEIEHYFKKAIFGGVFVAANISAYQLNAWSPNVSLKTGYIIPQEKFRKRMNVGLHYYNGRSNINQFYNRKEKYVAFFVMFDV